jgi:hypothetical protein
MASSHGKYLGETPLDIDIHPDYRSMTPTDWALRYIEAYGQIDGGHHKLWVLDQVARILNGTPIVVVQAKWEDGFTEDRFSTVEPPSQKYKDWVVSTLGPKDEDGEYEYDYDEGIAP